MKKIVIFFFLIAYLFLIFENKKDTNITISSTNKQSTKVENKKIIRRTSIFIPYWALGQGDYMNSSYDAYYYFGITVDQNGVIKTDPGYTGLAQFNCPKTKKCYLVIRMLDNEINKKILTDVNMQKLIIQQSLDIADTYSFTGIALDLELSGIFNDEVTKQINSFVQSYYTSAKKNYKMFSFIVYGDNYYRKRPFDIKFIGTVSDEIMIMAYDFHKSYGEPGPNFSFNEKDKYNYDFMQMISDFSADISSEKLSVIFGMYGYDWTLNAQGLPLKRREAVTVNQMRQFPKSNSQLPITNFQDTISKEKKIEYIDAKNFKHVIYYEDEGSAAIKSEYLLKQGIGSTSYWAYGYF